LKNSGQTLVEKNKSDFARKISINPSAPVCKSRTDQSNLAGKIPGELCCKIFSRIFSKIILPGSRSKNFQTIAPEQKNLNKSYQFTPPKTTLFSEFTTFPIRARIALRSPKIPKKSPKRAPFG